MHNYKKIDNYEDFSKRRLNPIDFINNYNKCYKKSLIFKDDIINKKKVNIKSIISSFLPVLKNDYKKCMKIKKGGSLLDPVQTDTISNSLHQENLNNIYYTLPRNPDFTNVYNSYDLKPNISVDGFPDISTYSRS